MSDIVLDTLQEVRSKLLDISKRNRLLNYKETLKSLRIVDELPDVVYRFLVHSGKKMEFLPMEESKESPVLLLESKENISAAGLEHELPSSNGAEELHRHTDNFLQTPFSPTVLERRAKKLMQESRTAIEETGSNMLFLAIGFLEWFEDDNSQIKCKSPLILLPVRIEKTSINRKSNCYSYVLSYTEEDIETNLSLAAKLEEDFGLILPQLIEDAVPEQYFDAVKEMISDKPRWEVKREMVLGMFSFAKLLMYKDLDSGNWPEKFKLVEHPHIRQILEGRKDSADTEEARIYGEDYNLDQDARTVNLHLVTEADSSQTSVIVDVIHEKQSLAVEGPPGTGKSQTIANVIGSALEKGMTVLFVAEKKAALDVVRSRLNSFDLGDFCLELHSHKTQKGQMHEDLRRRISRQFTDHRTLDSDLNDLNHHKSILLNHTKLLHSIAGHENNTVFEIFWAAENCRSQTDLKPLDISIPDALKMSRQQLNERASLLYLISKLQQQLSADAIKTWEGFSPTAFLPGDEQKIKQEMSRLQDSANFLLTELKDHFPAFETVTDATLASLRQISKASINQNLPVPANFCQTLVRRFVNPSQRIILENLQKQFAEHDQALEKASPILDSLEKVGEETLSPLMSAAKAFLQAGIPDQEISGLIQSKFFYDRCLSQVCDLNALAKEISSFWSNGITTLDCCNKVTNLLAALETAPDEHQGGVCCEHLLVSTHYVFNEAIQEYQRIVDTQKDINSFFLPRYMPDEEGLFEIAKGLRKYRGSLFAIFSSEYRSLRNKAKSFLASPASIKAKDLIEWIEGAAELSSDIAKFGDKERYRCALGPNFKGMDTNWSQLRASVDWGQNLSSILGSDSHAYKVFPDLVAGRKRITETVGKMQQLKQEVQAIIDASLASSADKLWEIEDRLQRIAVTFTTHIPGISAHPELANRNCNDILALGKAYADYQEARRQISENAAAETLLGAELLSPETDLVPIMICFDWVQKLTNESGLDRRIVDWILSSDTENKLRELSRIIDSSNNFVHVLDGSTNEIGRYFSFAECGIFKKGEGECSILEVPSVLQAYIREIPSLVLWCDYAIQVAEAKSKGMSASVEAIRERQLAPEEADALYRWAMYDSMAREIIAQYPELARFTRSSFEQCRETFAELDKRIMKNHRQRVAFRAQRSVPRGIGHGLVRDYSDDSLIRNEIRKQKKHIPIRQLVRRANKALLAYKPCWMMSPMSVAQYLPPGEIVFDLLIMDEASQVKPEDALGAIARAKQILIVGDSKQLPPTSFFDRTDRGGEDDNDDNATVIKDTESILDICSVHYQNRRLRWHYRSEHESLIAFSNSMFYDNELVIFPSATARSRSYGVHHHYIEGAKYLSGKNKVEAEAVVLGVVEHFRKYENQTLGVATFNREQADLITDLLEKAQKEHPWLERKIRETENTPEPFFVKNLENVQGDERDVIYISTTYGPDPSTGKVAQRFGPLTQETGWRRLNVIVTRAKKRLEIFTSMRSTEIIAGTNASRGPRMLKAYLEYAETGIIADFGTDTGKEPDSDFEVSVIRLLAQHGYKTQPQVGVAGYFIDLAVIHPDHPGQYILGIECDGAQYHSAKSARDRDRLRQEILEKKGWVIHRIWSTDWFKNRDREVTRLLEVVKDAVSKATVFQETPTGKFDEDFSLKYVSANDNASLNDSSLREVLSEYLKANIQPNFPDLSKSILRPEVIDLLVKFKPVTKDDFYNDIPIEIRQATDGRQMQFLEDIFEIVDAYS